MEARLIRPHVNLEGARLVNYLMLVPGHNSTKFSGVFGIGIAYYKGTTTILLSSSSLLLLRVNEDALKLVQIETEPFVTAGRTNADGSRE